MSKLVLAMLKFNLPQFYLNRMHYISGLVFTKGFKLILKGLGQGLGLNLILLYGTLKPKPWLNSFVNTGPVLLFTGEVYISLPLTTDNPTRLLFLK